MLHIIFQNQGIPPGVVMGVRGANEPVTEGERAFMLMSTRIACDDSWLPVKISNLVKPNSKT